MSARSDASTDYNNPKIDTPSRDTTTDTADSQTTGEPRLSTHSRPPLRDLLVFGGLFVAYVTALIAISVWRAIGRLVQYVEHTLRGVSHTGTDES